MIDRGTCDKIEGLAPRPAGGSTAMLTHPARDWRRRAAAGARAGTGRPLNGPFWHPAGLRAKQCHRRD